MASPIHARPAHDDDAAKYQHVNPVILDYLRTQPDAAISMLDVGCANGALGDAVRALGKAWSIDGVDHDQAALAWASERGYRQTLCVDLNREHLALAGPYDLVVMGDVLEHIVNPDWLLERAAELLAPDGRLVVSLPNIAFFWCRVQLLVGRWEYREMGIMDRTHLRFFTLSSMRTMFLRNGLQSEIVKPYVGESGRGRWARSIIRWLARRRPAFFAPQIVHVLRR